MWFFYVGDAAGQLPHISVSAIDGKSVEFLDLGMDGVDLELSADDALGGIVHGEVVEVVEELVHFSNVYFKIIIMNGLFILINSIRRQ